MIYSMVVNVLMFLGKNGDNVLYFLNFLKFRQNIINDIIDDFLLCRFVFYFLEVKINKEKIKNSLLLKLILFYCFLIDIFFKFGNEVIVNVSFQ